MKTRIISGILAVLLGPLCGTHGALYTENFNSVNTAIPVGNPVGIVFNGLVSDIPVGNTVAGLTISFNVTGGYNGNLYAYLVAPNGTMVVLLNQPGVTGGNPFGYAGSGFNVTLSGSASQSIQSVTETPGVQFTGTYQPAGNLANFNGSVADGTWELYFADLSSGGGTSTLNDWSLGITAVPEPVGLALALFGGLLGLWWCLGVCWKKVGDKNAGPEGTESVKQ